MTRFSPIDLARLPAPAVIAPLSLEEILLSMRTDVKIRAPEWALDESDPASMLLEAFAGRELRLRQQINEAARALLLAFAGGSDLDHLAANVGVARYLNESDDLLRARTQLAFESYTTAGSAGAYVFHARSASRHVADVSVTRGVHPGAVIVTILADTKESSGDPARDLPPSRAGVPDEETLRAVREALEADDIRPLTDEISVRPASFIDFDIDATLSLLDGPDAGIVLEESGRSLNEHLADTFRLGRDLNRSGLFAALHRPGVAGVRLTQPDRDFNIDALSVARVGTITLASGGRDG